MGRFQGKLLLSDYDNTLRFTEPALLDGKDAPPISPQNIEALQYWIDEGGYFALATGRALAAVQGCIEGVPMNAPAIVDNGGAIYDFMAGKYVVKHFLPSEAWRHIALVMDAFPRVSLELYREDNTVQVMRPTSWNVRHAKLTGLTYAEILSVTPAPVPLTKALFVGELPDLKNVRAFMEERGWAGEYERIFSSDHLLELTARGANKGEMARRLKELCGCDLLFCIGDHLNDLPMLSAADRAFCPANAQMPVLTSGATIVCHCQDGAIADVVKLLA